MTGGEEVSPQPQPVIISPIEIACYHLPSEVLCMGYFTSQLSTREVLKTDVSSLPQFSSTTLVMVRGRQGTGVSRMASSPLLTWLHATYRRSVGVS